jgi:hypothetical protein
MKLDRLHRREFIALLGGGTAAWPSALRAQQPAKLPTIGFIGSGTPAADVPWTTPFVQRLHELGWIEGRTIAIEYGWGEEIAERYAAIAAEFVRLKVDVMVTGGTIPVAAAKRATAVIPIVFAAAGDPIGAGLVASLARPGGNVTGLSVQQPESAAKRLELLRELVPGLRRLAILLHVDNPATVLDLGGVQAAARTLGLELVMAEVRRAEDIAPAIAAAKGRADALYVATDPLLKPTASGSPSSQSRRGCRRCAASASVSKPELLRPTGRTSPTCSVARPNPSTRSCAGRSRPTSRSSSRPSSRSLSILPPPRRWVCGSPSRSWCAPTR